MEASFAVLCHSRLAILLSTQPVDRAAVLRLRFARYLTMECYDAPKQIEMI